MSTAPTLHWTLAHFTFNKGGFYLTVRSLNNYLLYFKFIFFGELFIEEGGNLSFGIAKGMWNVKKIPLQQHQKFPRRDQVRA